MGPSSQGERTSIRAWSRGSRADARLLEERVHPELLTAMTPTGRRATADLIRTLDSAKPCRVDGSETDRDEAPLRVHPGLRIARWILGR